MELDCLPALPLEKIVLLLSAKDALALSACNKALNEFVDCIWEGLFQRDLAHFQRRTRCLESSQSWKERYGDCVKKARVRGKGGNGPPDDWGVATAPPVEDLGGQIGGGGTLGLRGVRQVCVGGHHSLMVTYADEVRGDFFF
jgi:hypothetical protein